MHLSKAITQDAQRLYRSSGLRSNPSLHGHCEEAPRSRWVSGLRTQNSIRSCLTWQGYNIPSFQQPRIRRDRLLRHLLGPASQRLWRASHVPPKGLRQSDISYPTLPDLRRQLRHRLLQKTGLHQRGHAR